MRSATATPTTTCWIGKSYRAQIAIQRNAVASQGSIGFIDARRCGIAHTTNEVRELVLAAVRDAAQYRRSNPRASGGFCLLPSEKSARTRVVSVSCLSSRND